MMINTPQKIMTLLTNEEKRKHEESNHCHIWKEKKERDHCHYTGKYRGAAHSICNLKYKAPKEILVLFHNGSKYDYHFIINE